MDYLSHRVSEGARLDEILPARFGEATIVIVRGHDPNSNQRYVKDAYLNPDQAKEAVRRLNEEAAAKASASGTPPETFYAVTGTIGQLEAQVVTDPRSGTQLEDLDILMMYHHLGKLFRTARPLVPEHNPFFLFG